MESRRTSIRNTARGFTLLEVMVIIGLLVIVASFGLLLDMDSYRGTSFHSERDTVIAAIQKARSQAINSMCFGTGCTGGKPHGVYFGTTGQYVIFQGATYAARDTAVDEVIPVQDAATTVSGLTSVVFAEYSGAVTTVPSSAMTLTIANAGRSSAVTMESEGRIWWTN